MKLRKHFKKLIAAGLCATMLASVGIVSYAGVYQYSFESTPFYIDSAGGTGKTSLVKKTATESGAWVDFTDVLYNGPSSGIHQYVQRSTTAASAEKSLSWVGTFYFAYKSGMSTTGSYYRLYGYTDNSNGYAAQIKGSWTP